MEMIILSLKTLYMTLMNEDFPMYSESVISRNDRKGQTMLRFWQSQIIEEFRALPYGKMIWRNDGRRNRYTSYLCNRSAEIKNYSEYAAELISAVNTETLLNQMNRFEKFLSGRKYRHDIFMRRIRELICRLELEDSRVTEKIVGQVLESLNWKPESAGGSLFQAAYLLTILMIYAAAGEAMDKPVMAVLQDEAYSIENIWKAHLEKNEKNEATVEVLTLHSGILEDQPLPLYRFFGREEELFDLKEMILEDRKCLLSGIGGIGKTELLRQMIRLCIEEKIVDKLAIVTYEAGIIESFARSFQAFDRKNPEEGFHAILYQLRKESEQGKVLLLIDNLTKSVDEDPDLKALGTLPCGILITTRRNVLDGFEIYRLKEPSANTGTLIFRDNYGKRLDHENLAVLKEIVSNAGFCHPLTLRLMARAAGNKSWTIQELKTQLAGDLTSFSWQDGESTVYLRKIYRQLYSFLSIPDECQMLAELFTLLPRASYDISFLCKYFPVVMENDYKSRLEVLAEGGWLDRDGCGYSMHPLIAQCLRRKLITEEKIDPLMCRIREQLEQSKITDEMVSEQEVFWQICHIFKHVSGYLSGEISREWLISLTTALGNIDATPRAAKEDRKLLDKLERKCPQGDELTEFRCIIVRCLWLEIAEEEYQKAYERQKEKRTIPFSLYLDFCLYAGVAAVYKHTSYPLGEVLLKEVLCEQATINQKAYAYSVLVDCCQYAGKNEEALQWCIEGNEYIHMHTECNEHIVCGLLSRLCQFYYLLGKMEQAREMVPELKKRLQQTEQKRGKYYLCLALAKFELGDGNPAASIPYTQEAQQIVEELHGRVIEYYIESADIAYAHWELKQYNEAIARYKEALEFVRNEGNQYWIQNFCNNIARVYLDMEEPKKALVYLDEAVEYTKTMGGLAHAAVLRNRANAFQQLGNREEEYHCLKGAVPLLEEIFGPENPHFIKASERLNELEL